MSIQPLVPFPEDFDPSDSSYNPVATSANSAHLLQLRGELGSVFVRPSRWQRRRLLWTFRHFRVLPSQVLSQSDRRLIEQLTHSALVAPGLPVPENEIFGVVEQTRSRPGESIVVEDQLSRLRVRQRGSLATLLCVGLIVSATVGALWMQARTHHVPHERTAVQTAAPPKPTSPVEKPKPLMLVLAPDPAPRPPAKPLASHPDPDGEVHLQAVIAADGKIENMTVLSGNPQLAEAALRSVRRWHNRQAPVESETAIAINYFGPDAVSITSLPRK